MGLFNVLKSISNAANQSKTQGAIDYGRNKNSGGHDHRTNVGSDRTPAQKEADRRKRK